MIFQQIKVGTNVIPFFRVILTRKINFLYYFMIQGHFQFQVIENMIFSK